MRATSLRARRLLGALALPTVRVLEQLHGIQKFLSEDSSFQLLVTRSDAPCYQQRSHQVNPRVKYVQTFRHRVVCNILDFPQDHLFVSGNLQTLSRTANSHRLCPGPNGAAEMTPGPGAYMVSSTAQPSFHKAYLSACATTFQGHTAKKQINRCHLHLDEEFGKPPGLLVYPDIHSPEKASSRQGEFGNPRTVDLV